MKDEEVSLSIVGSIPTDEQMFYLMGFLTEYQWRCAMDEFKDTKTINVLRKATYDRYSITYPEYPEDIQGETHTHCMHCLTPHFNGGL